MSKIIKCEHCGVEFEAKSHNTKFCSSKCRGKNRYKGNHKIIKCEQCEAEFKTQGYYTKFCSQKCKSKYWNEKIRGECFTPVTIKCECCAIEFKAKRARTRFCSPECKDKKYRNENLEKRQAQTLEWKKNNHERVKLMERKSRPKNREKNKESFQARERKHSYRKLGYPEELLEIKELQYQIKKEIKNQSKS
jgi:hypothetical protein